MKRTVWSSRARVTIVLLAGLSPGWPAVAGEFPAADLVIVEKAKRELHLMRGGEIFRTFRIALGIVPVGDKQEEGDFRTPEGRYRLDRRNADSEYFLSIRVSYPNSEDLRDAQARGVDPGGSIMIHGQPNVPTRSEAYYRSHDWTNGCVAVSNSDMIDIWLMTSENTPIEIRP
jgi:murein L,D-transpeptidase YafK